jgi:hypothetical protein
MQNPTPPIPLAEHPAMDELASIVESLPENRKTAVFDALYHEDSAGAHATDHALEDNGDFHENSSRDD